MYQNQMVEMRSRQKNLKDLISLIIKVSVIWLIVYLGVWEFIIICGHNRLGMVSLGIYMFINVLFPVITCVTFGFIFQAYFKAGT